MSRMPKVELALESEQLEQRNVSSKHLISFLRIFVRNTNLSLCALAKGDTLRFSILGKQRLRTVEIFNQYLDDYGEV